MVSTTAEGAPPERAVPRRAARLIPGLRWWMIGLVFLATAINYIDRQSLSLLFPVIKEPLGISDTAYANITTLGLAAYLLSQSISGRVYDRIGTKAGFACSIVVWSLASVAQSQIWGPWSFGAIGAVLYFGEAGNWPGAAKAIAQWFPVRERALGMAIFNSGVAVGGIVAPLAITWLQGEVGWRWSRVAIGSTGFLWLAAWLLMFDLPARHRRITDAELAHILDDASAAPPAGARVSWGELLRHRQTWAILLARFFVDPIWWLVVLWLPIYLKDARHLSIKDIGASAWFPYVFAGVGALSGGFAANVLIRRGSSVNRARKAIIAVAACIMPAGVLVTRVDGTWPALLLISAVAFGFQLWVSNVQTLPSDLFPSHAIGTVAGMGGTAAALGSMILTKSTGWVVTHYSYTPVFTFAALAAPLGTVLLLALLGKIQRVPIEPGHPR